MDILQPPVILFRQRVYDHTFLGDIVQLTLTFGDIVQLTLTSGDIVQLILTSGDIVQPTLNFSDTVQAMCTRSLSICM